MSRAGAAGSTLAGRATGSGVGSAVTAAGCFGGAGSGVGCDETTVVLAGTSDAAASDATGSPAAASRLRRSVSARIRWFAMRALSAAASAALWPWALALSSADARTRGIARESENRRFIRRPGANGRDSRPECTQILCCAPPACHNRAATWCRDTIASAELPEIIVCYQTAADALDHGHVGADSCTIRSRARCARLRGATVCRYCSVNRGRRSGPAGTLPGRARSTRAANQHHPN